jgi:hypothetical protein
LLLLLAYYHYHYHLYLYIIIIILFIYFLFLPSYSLLSLIFEIFDLMFSDWVSFLAYPNLFGIKDFVVVVMSMMLSLPLIFGRVTFGHAKRQCPPENVSLVPVQRKRLVMFVSAP